MPTYRPVLHPVTNLPVLNSSNIPLIYDEEVYPDGPPPGCCCGGCCPAESMPETLDLSITGNGDCNCYTRDLTLNKVTPNTGEAWRYDVTSDYTAACGGLDRSLTLWCRSTSGTVEGYPVEAGKTYATWGPNSNGGCHDPDATKPVPVTVLTCNPFHALVNIPLQDLRPVNNDCHCNGSIDGEITAPP